MLWTRHEDLAQQFVASFHFVHRRHDLELLGPNDKIREVKQDPEQKEGAQDLEIPRLRTRSLPPDEFKDGLAELARDLIIKEQQIEVLISTLPGLDSSEADQERYIRELEDELKVAEAQRQDAIKEKDQILAKLDEVIRSIRRP
ncbi:RNA polymerase II transcription mediator [Colletotrichum tofieldiae]|nr:RNA polymerase II transcription mediator [Colletotrichum tofieldiae]